MVYLRFSTIIRILILEKMDDFSSQLGMIKCSETRHFLIKFPSEGEFWHCHIAGIELDFKEISYLVHIIIPKSVSVEHIRCTYAKTFTNWVLDIQNLTTFPMFNALSSWLSRSKLCWIRVINLLVVICSILQSLSEKKYFPKLNG